MPPAFPPPITRTWPPMQPRSCGWLAAVMLAASIATARPAVADGALRVQRPLDLVALPLLVMEHEHLIERVAEAMGLGTVTVTWSSPDEGRTLEPPAPRQRD